MSISELYNRKNKITTLVTGIKTTGLTRYKLKDYETELALVNKTLEEGLKW